MKKFFVIAAGLLLGLTSAASAQLWQTLESDEFDAADIGFEPAVQVPANVNPANTQFVRDFDWTTITTPVLPTLPDSNGRALKTEVNTFDGAAQRQFALYDPGVADYAVEARILPYIADGQTSNTTEFVGIGIRMNDTFTEGYILQIRTDFSATFGSYAQLLRISPSTPAGSDILARIFYRQGSNYATFDNPTSLPNFIPGAKPIIRSPESNVENTWTTVRLEAIGNTIRVFVDDDDTPRVTFVDPTPFATGKAAVFHQDSFPSTVNASDRVLALYDYFTVETLAPEASIETFEGFDASDATVAVSGTSSLPGGTLTTDYGPPFIEVVDNASAVLPTVGGSKVITYTGETDEELIINHDGLVGTSDVVYLAMAVRVNGLAASLADQIVDILRVRDSDGNLYGIVLRNGVLRLAGTNGWNPTGNITAVFTNDVSTINDGQWRVLVARLDQSNPANASAKLWIMNTSTGVATLGADVSGFDVFAGLPVQMRFGATYILPNVSRADTSVSIDQVTFYNAALFSTDEDFLARVRLDFTGITFLSADASWMMFE